MGSAGRSESRAARWAALDAAGSAPALRGFEDLEHVEAEDPDIVTETESEDEEDDFTGGLFAE